MTPKKTRLQPTGKIFPMKKKMIEMEIKTKLHLLKIKKETTLVNQQNNQEVSDQEAEAEDKEVVEEEIIIIKEGIDLLIKIEVVIEVIEEIDHLHQVRQRKK